MGTKGEKRTQVARDAAEQAASRMQTVGPVQIRGMFGGCGLFVAGIMFGLVDSEGTVFLRAGADNREVLEKAGAVPHGRMPYYSIPATVWEDSAKLAEWSQEAAQIARAAKK